MFSSPSRPTALTQRLLLKLCLPAKSTRCAKWASSPRNSLLWSPSSVITLSLPVSTSDQHRADDIVWVSCFTIGRAASYTDISERLAFYGAQGWGHCKARFLNCSHTKRFELHLRRATSLLLRSFAPGLVSRQKISEFILTQTISPTQSNPPNSSHLYELIMSLNL